MANEITDPQWQKLIGDRMFARIVHVYGCSDGTTPNQKWVLYCRLSPRPPLIDLVTGEVIQIYTVPQYLTIVYDPTTLGISTVVSDHITHAQSNLTHHGEQARLPT